MCLDHVRKSDLFLTFDEIWRVITDLLDVRNNFDEHCDKFQFGPVA